MTFELKQVVIDGEEHTFSFIAQTGQMVCITGGTAERRQRWLLAMMGFLPIRQGFICIDGEPLTSYNMSVFRSLMSYAPASLVTEGEVRRYDPPSVQDVFTLRANRELPISNGILGEEMRRISVEINDDRIRLLAVAALLERPIMFVSNPHEESVGYLRSKAQDGKVIIVESASETVIAASDLIVELN